MKKIDIINKISIGNSNHKNSNSYSVALPLIKIDEEYHILYEVRAKTLRRQPSEVCFAGGKIELGETPKEACIRETSEELGVDISLVEYITELPTIPTPQGLVIFNHVVFINSNIENLTPCCHEVDEIFSIPLSYLLNNPMDKYYVNYEFNIPDDFPINKIPNGKNYNWNKKKHYIYFFEYNQKIIWGLTAKITNTFIEFLR